MSEPVTCPKCGYTRAESDQAPEWQCPACGVAYAKAAAAAAAGANPPPPRPAGAARVESRSGPDLRVWLLLGLLAVVALFHHYEREREADAERAAAALRPAKKSPAQPAPRAVQPAPAVPPSTPAAPPR